MAKYLTNSPTSACSWTGVNTFHPNTRPVTRTVIVKRTFGPTAPVGIAKILRQACAYSISALGICPTRGGVARVLFYHRHNVWGLEQASSERIANVPSGTTANCPVILHGTFCIGSTGAWAWIGAFFANTCLDARTVWINCAFRAAVGRASDVLGQARAGWRVSAASALGIGSARRWDARVYVQLYQENRRRG